MDRKIVLIAHNLRSCNNVGSLLRTADGLAIDCVYLTGYTPYPKMKNDTRLPHIRDRVDHKIHKTSLGAESTVKWHYSADIMEVIIKLRLEGHKIIALEQSDNSISLENYDSLPKLALIVGREVEGIEKEILENVDDIISIPMLGSKESFNVVQAAAMACYKFRYF
jgi:tRNA G18 (ribose-2'-O)-methylase SpoU